MYGSLLACSLESFVLDNDLIGAVMRATRGIEVTEETLSFEAVRDVCVDGPGHFLDHPQTLKRIQSEYHSPYMGDRQTPQEWRNNGAEDLLKRARERSRQLLANPKPSHIPPDVDRAIRKESPIRLPLNT